VLEWALNTASLILTLLLLLSADWTAFPADRTATSADRTIFPADWTPSPADQGALAAPSTSGTQNRTAKTTVLHDQPISKVRVIGFFHFKQCQLKRQTHKKFHMRTHKVSRPVRCSFSPVFFETVGILTNRKLTFAFAPISFEIQKKVTFQRSTDAV
jgi:hypothetical protein